MLLPRPNQLKATSLSVSQAELTRHSVELYPHPTAEGRRKIGFSLAQARKGFKSGRVFYDKIGNPFTIHDLPPKKQVVLHCSGGAKLQIKVP